VLDRRLLRAVRNQEIVLRLLRHGFSAHLRIAMHQPACVYLQIADWMLMMITGDLAFVGAMALAALVGVAQFDGA
jgi:hypothetical protein